MIQVYCDVCEEMVEVDEEIYLVDCTHPSCPISPRMFDLEPYQELDFDEDKGIYPDYEHIILEDE